LLGKVLLSSGLRLFGFCGTPRWRGPPKSLPDPPSFQDIITDFRPKKKPRARIPAILHI
jgi:hypothetical protein